MTDPTGAVVPNATVTTLNLATGATSHQQTGSAGEFTILALPVGTYRVTVEAGSFKKWEDPQVQLTVGSQVRVEPRLELGGATETVSVQSSNTGLQTESAAVETVVQMQQIRELPLATRNPLALVGLTPGIFLDSTDDNMRITYVQGNGLRHNRNNKTEFQLDGVNTNDGSGEGGTAVPNVDAIDQFNIKWIDAGAEFRSGSEVVIVTKSGTNAFHGSAFGFVQNDAFNAYNYFADERKLSRGYVTASFWGYLGD